MSLLVQAQTSPLSTGKWAKIAASKKGMYKLTGSQIKALGFSLPIASSQLQLFGFNLAQLSEIVPQKPAMGLEENAIKMVDGGDGLFEENDYLLFYNDGTVAWKFDPALQRFKHVNNTGTDTVYFFLKLGSNGKRIELQNYTGNGAEIKSVFNQNYLFEKDTISLLNSGKILWGLPMGQGSGKQNSILLTLNSQMMTSQDNFNCYFQLASTSYQNNGQFDFYLNDQLVHSSSLSPVSGLLFDDIASVVIDSFNFKTSKPWPSTSNLKINYNSANSSATGWIDYVEVHAKKQIVLSADTILSFGIEDGIVKGSLVDCKLNYTDSNYQIWNVTDPAQIKQINLDWHNDGTVHFYQPIDTIARFVAVKKNIFEVPIIIGPVSNQDALQPKAAVNYIIITAPAYLNAAIKYQQFQINQKGRNAIVINAAELYNDFSGGVPTAIAIRNYLKNAMNHAIENNWTMPEYALLLGLGNFNSKSLRPNFEIPVYETENSNSILNSYTTDDFYAVLNENDDINNPSSIKKLNIALGRIPVSSPQEADSVVNKLIAYQSNLQGGSWENKLTWIADDGDYNLHLQDAESIVGHLQASTNYWNHEKIYLDLFPAVASTSGNTYPLANSALQQSVLDGTLMINYTGHGNYLRLSEEAIISKDQIDNWDNPYKLPLLVTASCNFAPYDQTSIRPIAWDALMKNGKGIIGLVAASRLVFAYSNKQINDLFIQQLLVPNVNGKFWSLGNALMNAKMNNWLNGGDQINSFKFSLIGDPALTLSTPNRQLVVNQINNLNFSGKDTLLSGSKNNIKGQLKSNGKMDAGFNGILDLNVYDVIKYKKTLANQSTSMSVPIALQESLLFKGKASIVKGLYAIDFVLPNQATGTSSPLRMELAASGDMSSAILVLDSIYVKPNTNIQIKDTLGPQIKAYLNDSLFKSGNWATPNSTLYINLKDSAGIQSAGNVLGHDLSIWIDDNKLPIVLNNYYSADLDSYQSGKITYPLPVFSTGKHKLVIKAWDVLGNSNIDSVVFEVPLDQSLSIRNAFNFPNPFLNTTNFSVETNQVGKEVQIGLEVADVAGNLKYSVSAKFFNTKNIINIPWNGLTNTGSKLQPGVYFYKFVLKTSTETGFISNRILKL